LKQAKTLSEAFSQAAASHATVKLAAHVGSTAPNQSTIDDLAAPLAALYKASAKPVSSTRVDAAYPDALAKHTAPDAAKLPPSGGATLTLTLAGQGKARQGGLSLIAGQSLQITNGETVSLMSGQDSQAMTGGQLRIHSGQASGVRLWRETPEEVEASKEVRAKKFGKLAGFDDELKQTFKTDAGHNN
jgi:type VI secretion system secreted protein VgrG